MPSIKEHAKFWGNELRNAAVHDRSALLRIYDPQTETSKAIRKLQEQQKSINAQQKAINGAMVAVVSVVSIGFISIVICAIGIFTDNQRHIEQKYNEYVSVLEKQQSLQKDEVRNQKVSEIIGAASSSAVKK